MCAYVFVSDETEARGKMLKARCVSPNGICYPHNKIVLFYIYIIICAYIMMTKRKQREGIHRERERKQRTNSQIHNKKKAENHFDRTY